MSTAARALVATYIDEVWNKGRTDLVPELCAQTVVRHDANSVTQLTHAEQIARIAHNFNELRPVFEIVILAGDERDVTLVWNATGRDPGWNLCGVEIFRVIDGRISEVWNSPYVDGAWGTTIALWQVLPDGARALPAMSARFAAEAELVVPLDARNIAHWIGTMLAPIGSEPLGDGRFAHRFAGVAAPVPLVLGLREDKRPPTGFAGHATGLTIAIARSGLANATIALTGEAQPIPSPATAPDAHPTIGRLAQTYGHFAAPDGDRIVSEGTITLHPDGSAHGEVTLTGAPVTEPGPLTLGWRAGDPGGDFRIEFTMAFAPGTPLRTFRDGGTDCAHHAWRTAQASAVLVNDVP